MEPNGGWLGRQPVWPFGGRREDLSLDNPFHRTDWSNLSCEGPAQE